MFDGLKINCSVTAPWETVGRLQFILSIVEQTGEILNIKEATYNGLRFRVIERGGIKTNICLGSIHKYNNGGGLNDNDFNYNDVVRVLLELQTVYGVNLNKSTLLHLEYGVNIKIDFEPMRIINAAICHRGTPFISLSRKSADYGAICVHDDYELKIYDKTYKVKTKDRILRVELRTRRARILSAYGIRCLSDLLCLDSWKALSTYFATKIKEIVFADYKAIKGVKMSDKDYLLFTKVANRTFWQNIDKKTAYRTRGRYFIFLKKYGLPNLAELLAADVTENITKLMFNKTKCPSLLNSFLGTNSQLEYKGEKVAPGRPFKKNEINNKFNINKTKRKKMGKNMSIKEKEYIITYGYGNAVESVTLAPSEISTINIWLKSVRAVCCVRTGQKITGKAAINFVRVLNRKNITRENALKDKALISKMHQLLASGESIDNACQALGINKEKARQLSNIMGITWRAWVALNKIIRIRLAYNCGASITEIIENEKISLARIKQIIFKQPLRGKGSKWWCKYVECVTDTNLTIKTAAQILGFSSSKLVAFSHNVGLPFPRIMGTNKYKHSIVRLAKNGFSPVEIAARLGVSRNAIYRAFRGLGISRNAVSKPAARLGVKPTNRYKLPWADVLPPLVESGLTYIEIAARLGVKPTNHYKLPWADVLPPLVESGLTYIEIAARLGVSRITVSKHAARLGLKHIKSVSN